MSALTIVLVLYFGMGIICLELLLLYHPDLVPATPLEWALVGVLALLWPFWIMSLWLKIHNSRKSRTRAKERRPVPPPAPPPAPKEAQVAQEKTP